jgi:hypothetical protein
VSSDSQSDSDSDDDSSLARKRERGDDNDGVADLDVAVDTASGVDNEAFDYEDEELPDIPVVVSGGEPAKKKQKDVKKVWKWTSGDLEPRPQVVPVNSVRPKGMGDCRYPVDYFLKLFGADNMQLLTEQTNIQRVKEKAHMAVITEAEIRQTIGILMYMSVVSLPNIRLFWRKSMNISAVFQVMPRDRFENIISVLHLSNNAIHPPKGSPGFDKLYKVRPLLDNLNKSFKEHAEMELVTSVDEQMIPL